MIKTPIWMWAAIVLLSPLVAQAEEEGIRLTPIDHAATVKECGACHLAFPPQMLPMRSWRALMADLPNHFGEDASLPADAAKDISDYLVSHAADGDASNEGRWFLRKLAKTETPLRITETPFWRRAHHELSDKAFTRPAVKSAANCQACHRTAAQGEFFEEED